ncbi:CAT RNA binding domain-containing protein [Leptotrichia sp. OH3620_COT-345]|uniref:CAT RNA binding domain-containing protein n=1 Tax=Leptotrichia sp. OH3620_COT-345 TaxID=2491048 RepID=UPI001F48BE20|nr:CAT RNA binding domain-containing protein [Leptotrichia sp. OH3620_COT-345]
MIINKILNNNVVLSKKNGKEIIMTGKGIAFGKKAGDTVDKNKIEKTFILEYNEVSEKI